MATETRPPKGYRWGEATIQRWELVGEERAIAPAVVPALIHEAGFLCLHKPVVEGYGLWTVSHLPTGHKIWTAPTQKEARHVISCCIDLGGLQDSNPGSACLSRVWAMLQSLPASSPRPSTPARPRKPAPMRQDARSSFSPVFRGYVPTPATRAAANKAALAFGEIWNGKGTPRSLAALEEAAALEWREEIVVRVMQPPRALLLETDIPSSPTPTSPRPSGQPSRGDTARPSTGPTLRDGTPATPGEFRRRYQQLLDLGDRLRAGSLRFQTLYREGEAEGWTNDRLDRWERIDERFRALVFEGWMVWSGAALCYDVAPEEFQRNVVAKLGYIGSRERGYHDLGIKTFLRHPEIEEVLPLRREIRERIAGRL